MVASALVALMAISVTDQTVTVQRGGRLDVNNFAGDVVIKTWDKDQVLVHAEHSDREIVDVRPTEQNGVAVRTRSRSGSPRSIDYSISVPPWLPVSVSGTYADVTIEGVAADVTVETNRGDISVRGGAGTVTLKSVQGRITVEKAKGHIDIRAVNEGIRLADLSGDVTAETVNGSIILDRVDSANVDLYTVNGNISYDGPIRDKGLYRLTTHNGAIGIAVPEKTNATVLVRTYNGSFKPTFTVKTDADPERRNKKVTFTLGNGSAHVELESFGGTIALRRPGEARPEAEERRRRHEGDDEERRDETKEKAKEKVKEKKGGDR